VKVLVTGATGFVGKPLIMELLREKFSVLAVTRSSNIPFGNINFVNIGEINAQTNWRNLLNNIDVVIHLAARVHVMKESSMEPLTEFRKINVEGTAKLATQAAISGVKRFIYISSIKVNGEYTDLGKPFDEDDEPNPIDSYAVSKLEAEKSLLQISKRTDMEVVIIRPPLIYGKEVKANFANMLSVLQRRIPLPFGNIKNQRSLIYVGNLVNFIIKCIQHPNAANQIFLVSDGNDLSTTDLLLKCADALGIKARLFYIPKWLLETILTVLGKKDVGQRLCSNLQVNISKASKLLNWTPTISVNEGLKTTVTDWLLRK
jgi:nucleoside-diphosphate-sugar epimerase